MVLTNLLPMGTNGGELHWLVPHVGPGRLEYAQNPILDILTDHS